MRCLDVVDEIMITRTVPAVGHNTRINMVIALVIAIRKGLEYMFYRPKIVAIPPRVFDELLIQYANTGNKVKLIITARVELGWSLKDAKDFICDEFIPAIDALRSVSRFDDNPYRPIVHTDVALGGDYNA